MNSLPSNRVIIFTFIVIIVYSIIDFCIKGKNLFFQLNYNWDEVKKIQVIKNIKIDSLSYNFLRINNENVNKLIELSVNNSFSIDDKYYFRCVSIRKTDKYINFHGLYWINTIPTEFNQSSKLTILELPIIQKGKRTVCMIGDSQLNWLEGKYTRKNIFKKSRNIKFVGNYKDVFGFPYQAEILNNTKTLLDNITKVPNSDTYVLFIGAHESARYNIEDNLNKIIFFLLSKRSNLILIVPPNYTNSNLLKKEEVIKRVYLEYKGHPKVKIIDLSEMLDSPDLFLMNDGIHLNLFGHQILTSYLIDALK